MKKIIVYSAFLIAFSILNVGSIMNINTATNDLFYNVSSISVLVSTLGFVIVAVALIKQDIEPID
jgi:hypothetical protein